jgi:hypothetical protein
MTGLAAMEDPGSAAARFRDWRQSSDAERDLSYLASFTDADHNFTAETEPQAIGGWRLPRRYKPTSTKRFLMRNRFNEGEAAC